MYGRKLAYVTQGVPGLSLVVFSVDCVFFHICYIHKFLFFKVFLSKIFDIL